ncbi:MAG: polysaccharide deacetylase family protein [Nitrosopumilaceae archaeon]
MTKIKNIMSVDLEDYYCDLPFDVWNSYESRVIENTRVILELFDRYKVTATFFTLGYIAEKHPELIEEIVSKGHEIASHSYSHKDIRKITPEEFETDLVKSIQILRKVSGEKITGFRAPFFSIDKTNLWAFKVIKKHLQYDSSIFPTKTPLYGIPDAPRYCYNMSETNPLAEDHAGKFVELPMATLRVPLLGNIPIAGGFHMRFLPLALLKFGIKKINKNGFFTTCYIHPKDLDPQMPRIPEYSWYYYWGLNDAKRKFESLLKNFVFSSIRETIPL